jgi:hypothetical protein
MSDPSPIRDVDGISEATFQASTVNWFYFVKIEFPAVTPFSAVTLRYTQRKGGFVGDIDGSSQTWDEYDFKVEGLAQSHDSILEVSSINLQNTDGFWTYKMFAYGLRGRWVTVYQVWLTPSLIPTLVGKYILFQGQIDEAELTIRAQLSLTPFRTPFAITVPGRRYSDLCGYIYKDPATCQYVGAVPTCDRTRNGANGCNPAHANQSHFGGFDLLPKPNTTLTWGKAALGNVQKYPL